MRRAFIIAFSLLMLLVACTPQPTGKVTNNMTIVDPLDDPLNAPPIEIPLVNETDPVNSTPTSNTSEDRHYTKVGMEGELIELNPVAYDEDNNTLTYIFSPPFDARGRWYTKVGDEGRYLINISVSDGHATTNETILVRVQRANRPPVIACEQITIAEGELINLSKLCTITDEDNSNVSVNYSGWMSSAIYTPTFADAGPHNVVISASDITRGVAVHTVKTTVQVMVRDVNREPVFADSFPTELTAVEGDTITIPRNAIDPDGQLVEFSFSGPFDKSGVWKTNVGDAGSYNITVTAQNGDVSSTRDLTVKVGLLNTAPTLTLIPDIAVSEGETIKLPISATDREGNNVTITIEGWMTDRTYKTTYDDAGNHQVKITASDGILNSSQIVRVTVQDVNRPPVFIIPA